MKSGKFCDYVGNKVPNNYIIPMEIQGENYTFDSYDCVRIFHKLNAVYDNLISWRLEIRIDTTSSLTFSNINKLHTGHLNHASKLL